ncbi:Ribosomal-protein-alanine acetyltransferase [bacterium HR40]|nr:Ribosomal-protein-alanine acetyltransferase [bacterium HR40]
MLTLRRPAAIVLKPVGPFDLGRMARLHRMCFEDGWSRTDLSQLLAMPGAFGLLARCRERSPFRVDTLRTAGFALVRIVGEESELLSIGVAPAFRRRGVGRELLRACLERCRRAGCTTMFLEVAVDNLAAQRLYESHGFRRVGVRPDYYRHTDGSRSHAFTMRCDLALGPSPTADNGDPTGLSDRPS